MLDFLKIQEKYKGEVKCSLEFHEEINIVNTLMSLFLV